MVVSGVAPGSRTVFTLVKVVPGCSMTPPPPLQMRPLGHQPLATQ